MYNTLELLRINIEKFLTAAGISQSELARRASIARSQLTRIFDGSGNPQLDTIQKIAEAFKVQPFELFLTEQSIPNSADRALSYAHAIEAQGKLILEQQKVISQLGAGNPIIEPEQPRSSELESAFQNASELRRAAALAILRNDEAGLEFLADLARRAD